MGYHVALMVHAGLVRGTMATDILFVDVDGTLITTKGGKQYIPPSALEGLAEVRSRGGRVYLCTGRSLAEALTIGEVPIDGIIGAAGGFVLDGDTMVLHDTFTLEQVAQVEGRLRELGAAYYLESNSGLYFDEQYLAFAREAWGIGSDSAWDNVAKTLDEVDRADINKACFFVTSGISYDEAVAPLADHFTCVESSYEDVRKAAGEISLPGVSKATAIRALLDHLGLPDVRTFGFGDSANDIPMLEVCDEAIVMGDARHGEVSAYATYMTKPVLEDGLAYALQHFGLVG